MLNTFPSLLTYGFFAPTLLRLAVALVFAYIAWTSYSRRDALAQVQLPVVGRASWAVWFAIVVEAVVAVMLFVGYHTQIAAILGAIGALKFIVLKRQLGSYAPLSRIALILLLVICLSLMISGAGALAIDLPL